MIAAVGLDCGLYAHRIGACTGGPAIQAPGESRQGRWVAGLGGKALLEDLVRAADRDPQRQEPVRRLIADLRSTPEGREIVPDELYAIWEVVDGVVGDDSHLD